jgi:hypothetical protein
MLGVIMKNQTKLFFLLLVIVFSSCWKQSTTPEKMGSVSGRFYNPFAQTGVADVLVYLLSKDVEIDTISGNNRHAFVDSAVTDSGGNYIIDNIKTGNYAVVPLSEGNFFTHDTTSDSSEFEITDGENFNVNYSLLPPIDMGGVFTIVINFVNQTYANEAKWINVSRKRWILFVPVFDDDTAYEATMNSTNNKESILVQSYSYGYTAVAYTVENTMRYKFGNHLFYVSFPINNTPATSDWEYDCTTKELKRL